MEDFILSLMLDFKELSYFGIILALTFEFVPAELVLPLVGFWVFSGDLNFYLAVLAGSIGGTSGTLTLYGVGRIGGRPFIEKYGKLFFIKKKHLDESDEFFNKHGNSIAFTGRFIPGIRTLISIPCGISKMNPLSFTIYTFLAMLPITFIYIYIGIKFGDNWKKVPEIIKHYSIPLSFFIMILSFIFLIIKKNKTKHSAKTP